MTDKTPGPEGFPMEVYRKCWNFMRFEIMEIVGDLQEKCLRNWKLNTSFMVLIPKKDGEKEAKDFRPISLIHGV